METGSKYNFAQKAHDFYFENGGDGFDLWRNVVRCFADTHNFHVSLGVAQGERFNLDHAPTPFDEINSNLVKLKARLENCGYFLNVRDSGVDPLGFQMDMKRHLAKLEGALLCEAQANFDNESPAQAPLIDG